MTICYAAISRPTAQRFAALGHRIVRSGNGDINWGRASANTSLNPNISNSTNKRVMRELFREHNVPTPELYPLHQAHALAKEGKTLVGRPDHHTGGRGFWKVDSNASFMQASCGTRTKKAATHFMEFVTAPREYRVHIFDGKSIRISEKLFGQTGTTSHGSYITGKPRHNINHVRAAAKQAVAALGLNFGAVDVLANDTECWVTEVNSSPGLGGTMPAVYIKAFTQWAERN